jgi:N-acetylmuramic acid 6-phosphate etherase
VTTEDRNPRTVDIDTLPTSQILRRINAEDATVAPAVERELPAIEAVVDRVVDAFRAGGRLIYAGAGTSGRLGVLDAAECPPTYSTDPRQVQALLAGAPVALTRSVEGAEDAELVIAPRTGPEVIAGSTRMKAGTAQKMVLNMISTAAMIRTGHTYSNLMVNVQATNSKLRERARRIAAEATGVDADTAARALAEADGQVKTAMVMLLSGVPAAEARERLARAGGIVRQALQNG